MVLNDSCIGTPSKEVSTNKWKQEKNSVCGLSEGDQESMAYGFHIDCARERIPPKSSVLKSRKLQVCRHTSQEWVTSPANYGSGDLWVQQLTSLVSYKSSKSWVQQMSPATYRSSNLGVWQVTHCNQPTPKSQHITSISSITSYLYFDLPKIYIMYCNLCKTSFNPYFLQTPCTPTCLPWRTSKRSPGWGTESGQAGVSYWKLLAPVDRNQIIWPRLSIIDNKAAVQTCLCHRKNKIAVV